MSATKSWYMTKPANANRFNEWASGVLDPRKAKILMIELLPCWATLVFLPEDAGLARERLSGVESDYDPTVDEDRFAVFGRCEAHDGGCPCFEELRHVLAIEKDSGVRDGIASHADFHLCHGYARIPRIHKGDGLVGPVSDRNESERLIPLASVCEISRCCEYAARDSSKRGQDGKDVVGDVGKGCAGGGTDGHDETFHGRIVSFLRRIFNREAT